MLPNARSQLLPVNTLWVKSNTAPKLKEGLSLGSSVCPTYFTLAFAPMQKDLIANLGHDGKSKGYLDDVWSGGRFNKLIDIIDTINRVGPSKEIINNCLRH